MNLAGDTPAPRRGLRGLCPHRPQQGASPPAPPIAPRPKGSEGRACPSLHNSVFGIQLLARVSRAGKPALANASCLTAVHRQTCGLPQGLFCGGSVSDNPPTDRSPRKWLPRQPSLVKAGAGFDGLPFTCLLLLRPARA